MCQFPNSAPRNYNIFRETSDKDSCYRFVLTLQSQTDDNDGIDKSPIGYDGTGLGTSWKC